MSSGNSISENIDKAKSNVYEYINTLEEQIKDLVTRNSWLEARNNQIERNLKQTITELESLKNPPLIVGIINEVDYDNNRVIIKNSTGTQFVSPIAKEFHGKLEAGQRVGLTQRNLAIAELLPKNKDYRVTAMEVINKPKASFEEVGGLEEIKRDIDEAIILPIVEPHRFKKLGIKPPAGVLLYGPPGTGKTLLAKAIANKTNSTFIRVAGSELVRKFVGEGAGLVRDVFRLAEEKKPAIIFIDEIDAVAAHRVDAESGANREVERTLMQLLSDMDGFHEREDIKVIAATNRIDILDSALLRPGRFDRIIEVPVPDFQGRREIYRIHTRGMSLSRDVNLDILAGKSENATGAEIRAVCTEAGIHALRENKKKITMQDFEKAISKVLIQDEAEEEPKKMFS